MIEMVQEVNCETGEEIVRPMTEVEFEARVAQLDAVRIQKEIDDAAEATRQSAINKLSLLGLSEEEIKAIIKI